MKYIRSLNEFNRNDIALAGGKGANLGALIQAGLPVPAGFCVTTDGYRTFIHANHLNAKIQDQVARIQPDDPEQLDTASAAIRQLFEQGEMPADMVTEIQAAYRSLASETNLTPTGANAVAVRSSATAEDLPDLSFAGQQDTYLNIIGETALLNAVVRCWASLWTARAIGYRARSRIAQDEVALAVVIQLMIPSEAAGVLFTANPLTGKRAEIVIDATLGLGEALVSGMVEPDHYVVEAEESSERILKKTLGNKACAVRGVAEGGTQVVAESAAAVQALPDAQILELAHLGQAAEGFFGAPQDVEWAWAGGHLYVLQSRAITSLYPLPERPTATPDHTASPFQVFFSFAMWQGMLQPISPLGQDSFTGLATGMAHYFGSQVTIQDQNLLLPAGDRLYVNITDLVRSPTGREIARLFIGAIDPVSADLLEELLKDPRLALDKTKMSLPARLRLIRALSPLILGVAYNLLWPARGRERLQSQIEKLLRHVNAKTRTRGSTARELSEQISAIQSVPDDSPTYLMPHLLPGIVSGQAPFQILARLAAQLPEGQHLVMELTRGLPNNVTTEMDLKLWSAAQIIRSDVLSYRHFQAESAEMLSAEYLANRLPPVAQQALADFFQTYGMRGIAEIDLLKPRWKDDPLHILQVLQSYLERDENTASPEVVFQNGAERARQAGEALVAGLRRTRYGIFKARLARFLISRFRELGGLRETPKFTIVRVLGVIRDALTCLARTLVEQGMVARPEDIFFLHQWELKALVEGELPGAQALIEQRRQFYEREMNRRRVPRILLSDGTSYYEGLSPVTENSEGVLTGSPVSPGVVEGVVRVVLDPHGTRLLPGEILVCPATDPAWTPLFLTAGGLVMEVGGMMTHGSVVAREYGIPAVVGVNQVTTRLKTGQRIRLDGSLGQIQVLE